MPTMDAWKMKLWDCFMWGKEANINGTEESTSKTKHSKFVTLWFPIVSYLMANDIIPKNPYCRDLIYF